MEDRNYGWLAVLGTIIAVGALLVATASLITASDNSNQTAGQAKAQVVDIELGDFFIRPAAVTWDGASPIQFRVTNVGAIVHNLTVEDGPKTADLKAGETATLQLAAGARFTDLICSVPGHAEAGMRASLARSAEGAPQNASAMDSEEMDESYLAGVKAFPAKTKGQGNQPMPLRIENGVKVFELTASEIEWEVSPGEKKQAFAYNEQVPGPMIRVDLGDRVRVILHNRMRESTSIHFHGLVVPNEMDGVPGITQPLVKPGADYTYEFTVRNSGSHMYHSHMNGAAQIPGGLLGAFIVDDPAQPTEARDQLMILNDGPLGFTINGKGFPATQPLILQRGERMRIRYMNEGLQIHPMHLHGLTQTVVAKDGYPLPQPLRQDTVLVAPGERIDVLVEGAEPGTWALHCHILNHAETHEGMFGMVTAVVVQ